MRYYLLWLLLAALSACTTVSDSGKGEVVAKVYGNYLYEADLKGLVASGTSKQDSIMLVKRFIDNWIRKQLLIRQAEKNLTAAQTDFSQELEDYRTSLLIYTYETELIKQKLDTVVSEAEINAYYENNKQNFELRHNLVKVVYTILPVDSEMKPAFREFMSNPDTLLLDSLDLLASSHALSYYNDTLNWIRFDDLITQIPLETLNQEAFLKSNTFVEIDDSPFCYLLRIEDYLLSEGISPLEIEYENIKNILLNQRRQALLRQTHDGLYEQALRQKVFEIY
jgi:hypothetical protein